MTAQLGLLAGGSPWLLRGPIFSRYCGVLFALDVLLAVPAWTLVAAQLDPGKDAHGRPGFVVAALASFLGWFLFLYALGLFRRDAMLELRRSLGRTPLAAGLAGVAAWMVAQAGCLAFAVPCPVGAAWQAELSPPRCSASRCAAPSHVWASRCWWRLARSVAGCWWWGPATARAT